MKKEELRIALARPATIFETGGFRPVDDPFASWIGKVQIGKREESWPISNGKAMIPLCQLNLSTVAFKPKILSDIAFITIFVDSERIASDDEANGTTWCLRAYKSLDGLVEIAQMGSSSRIKPFQLREIYEPEDFPCWEDVPFSLPSELDDEYYDLFENSPGHKIGGWPTLIQGEVYWAPWNRHPAKPEFAFQIDSDDKAHWQWGHAGVGYFGRGTTEGMKDEWCFS